jgi:hypothetical protein
VLAAVAAVTVGAGLAAGTGAPDTPSIVLGIVAATFTAVACTLGRNRPALGAPAAGVVVAIVLVELVATNVNSGIRDDRMDQGSLLEESETAQALDDPSGGRILALGREGLFEFEEQRRALRPNTHVFDDLRSIDGYDGGLLVSRHWVEAMRTLADLPGFAGAEPLRFRTLGPFDRERFVELDVTRVVAHGIRPDDDFADRLPEGSRRLTRAGDVEIWETPSLGPVFLAGGDRPNGLRLQRDPDEPERIVVEVPPAATGRRVVVSEALADGWSASGGIELSRHHDLLTSFVAPPGGGRVVLTYAAPGLAAGTAVTFVALGLAGAWVVWGRRNVAAGVETPRPSGAPHPPDAGVGDRRRRARRREAVAP